MDMQQDIKPEIVTKGDKISDECIMDINGLKKVKIVMDDTDNGIEESLNVRTEFKSENAEELLKFNSVKYETLNSPEIPQDSVRDVKHEIKSEEMDITYSSVCLEKDVSLKSSSLPDTTIFKEEYFSHWNKDSRDNVKLNLQRNHNLNSKELEKQWQKMDPNQLNTEASNFKSYMIQGVKDISFSCFSCNYSTNLKSNLVEHMLLHGKRNNKTLTSGSCNYSIKYKHYLVQHKLMRNKEKETILSCKTHSKKSLRHRMLNYEKKHSCKCCERQFKFKQSLDDHVLKNHQNNVELVSSKIHNCATCDYKTTIKTHLRYHIMKVHSGNYEKHSCKHCEKLFKNKVSLDDHLLKKHQYTIDTVSRKVHKCPICDYKTTISNNFRTHVRIHSGNYIKHSCALCERNFKSKRSLDDHLLKNHEDIIDMVSSKVYNCPACEYKTTASPCLRRHMTTAHSGNCEKHTCKCCGKQFRFKPSLDDHVLQNHQDNIELVSSKIHICPTCDYKTTIKSSLRYHVTKVHSGKCKNHLCEHCEKLFKNKVSLDDHLLRNHQDVIDSVSSKVHNCPTCDYKTTIRNNLRRHMTIHSGNEIHSCKYCEKRFQNNVSLDDHLLKNHVDIIDQVTSKVHNCPTCDYKTTINYNFRRHLTMHSGNYKKHPCTLCEKHFKSKRSLDDHILKNHQDFIDYVSSKVHNCPTCHYKTTSTSMLKCHIVQVHFRKL